MNHLCWSFFLIKLQAFRPATQIPTQVFFSQFCEISKNTYFEKRLQTAGSKDTCLFQQQLHFKNIEHFLSFVFNVITVQWNHLSKCKNILSYKKSHLKFPHSTETSFYVFHSVPRNFLLEKSSFSTLVANF